MKQTLFLSCLLALTFLSCKKDEPDNTSVTPTGTRLAKVVSTDGSYTSTTSYGYGTDGKLISVRVSQASGGSVTESGYRIYRSGDMISKVRYRPFGSSDSVTMNVNFSGQRYTTAETVEATQFGTVTTRTTFTYNNEGRVAETSEVEYVGSVPDPQQRTTFSYTNGNLTSEKVYRTSTGTDVFFAEYLYEYDQKKNPLSLGTDWILLSALTGDITSHTSANNLIKITIKEVGSPDETYTATYVYNTMEMPASATFKSGNPADATQNVTFTYE